MNKDWSLIDANINRAEEGLRVVEDICRFVLCEPVFWAKLKQIRHSLNDVRQEIGWAGILSGRQGSDFGLKQVVNSEYYRQSLANIIQANVARVCQSMRVLEEFSKVYKVDLAYKLESLRYEMYVLEYKLLILTPHFWLNKYFTDGVIYPISDSVDELVWLINHGAKVVQLRDKNSTRREVYEKAKYVCGYLQKIKKARKQKSDEILFILNDDVEMASKLLVAGVHIGQDDGIISEVRKKIGSNKIIGRSNRSLEQIRQSQKDGADYCSIGPIFSTPTKVGRPAVGLDIISQVSREITVPWLAIGGVDKESIGSMRDLGAKNFAVVRSAREFYNKE